MLMKSKKKLQHKKKTKPTSEPVWPKSQYGDPFKVDDSFRAIIQRTDIAEKLAKFIDKYGIVLYKNSNPFFQTLTMELVKNDLMAYMYVHMSGYSSNGSHIHIQVKRKDELLFDAKGMYHSWKINVNIDDQIGSWETELGFV